MWKNCTANFSLGNFGKCFLFLRNFSERDYIKKSIPVNLCFLCQTETVGTINFMFFIAEFPLMTRVLLINLKAPFVSFSFV